MSSLIDGLRRRARRSERSIVLAEGGDPRVVAAARMALDEAVCRPLLLGDAVSVATAAAAAGVESAGIERLDPATVEMSDEFVRVLEARSGELDDVEIERRARDPLYLAGLLVATGRADGAVMGAVATTADTLRAVLRTVGPDPAHDLISSCFLMALPDGRGLIYSDGGVVPEPSSEQLAAIAEAAAGSCRTLLDEAPRVALLSFSTKGSARHPKVDKVRRATEILAEREVDFVFDGELQADAALVPSVAERKAPGSPLAGGANVLVFPDLDAGNIAYKLTQRLAGARAIGPLLQGACGPVHDLSRGASPEDIVDVVTVAALGAQEGQTS